MGASWNGQHKDRRGSSFTSTWMHFTRPSSNSTIPACTGRPVIVGADPKQGLGRGVVAACSYEARKFGVRSALPISRAWKLCPEGVVSCGPRMERYVEVSHEVMEVLRRFTNLVEPLSIDEAFLDVTGIDDPVRRARSRSPAPSRSRFARRPG